jgi:hypothetical protein
VPFSRHRSTVADTADAAAVCFDTNLFELLPSHSPVLCGMTWCGVLLKGDLG